ncbi:uncharacterized protein LOC108327431 [Vigna angularis]|uniref:uncharacterized protein LOC108327431 n=1 Tax=Phaseolus angularis TaxID=3914 RepID=UPI0022B4CC16|nr:uncharacterized protein LOC108327431 [Vigna angularis]
MPLTEALQQTPAYAKHMKQFLGKKKKYLDEEIIEVQGNCNAIMQKILPPKFIDPGSFTIPFKPTRMMLQLADRSVKYPHGVVENMVVKIDKLQFLVDFVVTEMEENAEVPLILGRPFMKTAKVVIHVDDGVVTLKDQEREVTFNVFEVGQPIQEKQTSLKIIDEVLSVTSLPDKAIKLVKKGLSCFYIKVEGEDEEKEGKFVH